MAIIFGKNLSKTCISIQASFRNTSFVWIHLLSRKIEIMSSSIYIVVLSSLMRAIVRYDIRLNCSDNRQQWKCRNSIHIYWIGSNLIRKFKARTHAYSAQMCILVIYQTIWIASLCHPKCTFYAPFHIQITFPQQQYNIEIVHVYLCHRSLLFVQNDSTPQNTLFWIHIEYINFKRPSQFSIIFYTK